MHPGIIILEKSSIIKSGPIDGTQQFKRLCIPVCTRASQSHHRTEAPCKVATMNGIGKADAEFSIVKG
jgi:hypothetical protein